MFGYNKCKLNQLFCQGSHENSVAGRWISEFYLWANRIRFESPGQTKSTCILHRCIPVNIRLFTTIFKGAGEYCFRCIGITDMFCSFCLRKVLDTVLGMVPFGFPKLVMCNKNILHRTFNFCRWSWTHCTLNAFLQIALSVRITAIH
jgi:hypothetical protein